MQEQVIEWVVLSGGPCGGKSSSIPRIKKHFKGLGWMVLVSSEVPTRLVNEHDYVPGKNISFEQFQEVVLAEVIRQEEELFERARASGEAKVLILCDRGRFDGLAYSKRHEDFYAMAKEMFGLGKNALFRHYSGCVFLKSPAVDAPHVYEKHFANNEARREVTREEGIHQNNLSLTACVGVSRLYIVDNSTDFEGKIRRVIKIIEHLVSGVEHEKKYAPLSMSSLSRAVAKQELLNVGVHFAELHIEQGYLLVSEEEALSGVTTKRVRAETLADDSQPSFILTHKGEKVSGGGKEEEIPITELEYQIAMGNLDPQKRAIRKTRFLFVYDGRYCELDVFSEPEGQCFILEIEHLPDDDMRNVKLPYWLGGLDDVTGQEAYANSRIADKRKP